MQQDHFRNHRKIDPSRGKELGDGTATFMSMAEPALGLRNPIASNSGCALPQRLHTHIAIVGS